MCATATEVITKIQKKQIQKQVQKQKIQKLNIKNKQPTNQNQTQKKHNTIENLFEHARNREKLDVTAFLCTYDDF